jgi:hypothetical protein
VYLPVPKGWDYVFLCQDRSCSAFKKEPEQKKPCNYGNDNQNIFYLSKVQNKKQPDNRSERQAIIAIDTVFNLISNKIQFSSHAKGKEKQKKDIIFEKIEDTEYSHVNNPQVFKIEAVNRALQVSAGILAKAVENDNNNACQGKSKISPFFAVSQCFLLFIRFNNIV